jgi:hypothetical protein
MTLPSRGIVLGYHGCDAAAGKKYLNGSLEMPLSNKDWDWLGHGIYFWEWSAQRAADWANEKLARKEIDKPFVVGAALDLGRCLDLTTTEGISLLAEAYQDFERAATENAFEIPKNSNDTDKRMRKLDCAVIRFLHSRRPQLGMQNFQSVRALLAEGRELYPGAGFREKTHTQIAVVDRACIRGLFAVPSDEFH